MGKYKLFGALTLHREIPVCIKVKDIQIFKGEIKDISKSICKTYWDYLLKMKVLHDKVLMGVRVINLKP